MHAEGQFAPESTAEARRQYASLAGAARTVTRETAKAMGFDREEYTERVTDEVRGAAHDALFASLLEVRIAERETFEDWREDFAGEVRVLGSQEVPKVTWHVVPFGADGPPTRGAGDENVTPVAVAATFQDEPEAATATLRRTLFAQIYRDVIHADPVETGAHGTEPPEADDAEGGETDGETDGESKSEASGEPETEPQPESEANAEPETEPEAEADGTGSEP